MSPFSTGLIAMALLTGCASGPPLAAAPPGDPASELDQVEIAQEGVSIHIGDLGWTTATASTHEFPTPEYAFRKDFE